nr:diguanylate cyclase [Gammaproteobacteria bacterium]
MTDNSNSTALIIDGVQQAHDVLAELLVAEGFMVDQVDHEHALERMGTQQADLVLVALESHTNKGLGLIAELDSGFRSTRSIALITQGDDAAASLALDVGASDYLETPLTDQRRTLTVIRKVRENMSLARDNEVLISRLQTSHTKLASANARLTALNTQLQTLAIIDESTDLFNRRYADQSLQQEFERFDRYRDPFSVLILEIDRYSEIVATLDEQSKIKVLQHVAGLVRQNGRNTDTVARYADAQFIFLLTRTPAENAVIVGERLRNVIEDTPWSINGASINMTISAGLAGASSSEPVSSLQELMERCDLALSQAQSAGGNQVCFYGDDEDEDEDGYL